MILLQVGVMNNVPWMIFAGAGIFLYGLAYFIVHDVIIHQRFKWFTRSDNTYIRAIRWAHKMHHKHLEKEDGESFGMLLVARKYWQKVRSDKARMHKNIAST
jgi:beta-carotene 3-hydroxylase